MNKKLVNEFSQKLKALDEELSWVAKEDNHDD